MISSPGWLSVAVVCVLIVAASRAASAAPLELGIPQSLGMQTKPDTTPQDFQMIRDMKFRYIRRGFYWSAAEKVKGQYDFTEFDRIFKQAKDHGFVMVAVLFSNNKLYEPDHVGGITTEAGRRGFAGYAAAMAERYKDQDVLWEIWNEPNTKTFWRKDGKGNTPEFAQEYTDLVKAVAPAMLAADPDCFILGGSVSNYWEKSYEWTEYCFQRGILKTGIRGWAVHPYGMKTPEEHALGHAITRDLFVKYGASADFPVLNTERGFAVKKPTDNDEGWSGGNEELALQYHSWHFVRQVMIDQMSNVPVTLWYQWGGEKFGFIDAGQERPVVRACATLVDQLAGYRYQQRLATESEQDYLLVFGNDRGERKVVAWTAPPPGQTPDKATPHAVTLPVSAPADTVTVDIYGQKTTLRPVEGKVQVMLQPAPQYLVLPPAAGQ